MKIFTLWTLLLGALSPAAFSFTLNTSKALAFNKDEVSVHLAGGFCARIGITDEEFLSIIGEATEKFWNTSPTSRLKLRKGRIVNVANAFYTGSPLCLPSSGSYCQPNPDLSVASDVLVSCNEDTDNFSDTSILGITVPTNTTNQAIIGSLILINDQSGNLFANKSRAEKVAIIAHELGHAFGLGHSPVQDSLMYYATVASRRSLGQDDIDGISYLYPKEQPISGCGTIDTKKAGPPPGWPGFFAGLILVAFVNHLRKKWILVA